MKRRLRHTRAASRDVDWILDYTEMTYDDEQAVAYWSLLQQAFHDIEQDPERASSRRHPELGAEVRSYHIELSKKRSGSGIKSPRHVIYYTLKHPGLIMACTSRQS